MNKKHLNSEKSIDNKHFKIKFGTTNCINTEVVYIECKSFLQPMVDRDDYTADINYLRCTLKDFIRRKLEQQIQLYDKSNFILDFDIATNGMLLNKKSFLTIQVFLKQRKELSFNELLNKTKAEISIISNNFAEEIDKRGFALSKTK